MDGAGKRSATGRTVGGPVPPLPRTLWRRRTCRRRRSRNTSITCGHWAASSSATSTTIRPCERSRGTAPPEDDRVRRPAPLSRRRGSAEIVRFHLPEVPPVPHRDGSLMLAVTHEFPRRGQFSYHLCGAVSPRRRKTVESLAARSPSCRRSPNGRNWDLTCRPKRIAALA